MEEKNNKKEKGLIRFTFSLLGHFDKLRNNIQNVGKSLDRSYKKTIIQQPMPTTISAENIPPFSNLYSIANRVHGVTISNKRINFDNSDLFEQSFKDFYKMCLDDFKNYIDNDITRIAINSSYFIEDDENLELKKFADKKILFGEASDLVSLSISQTNKTKILNKDFYINIKVFNSTIHKNSDFSSLNGIVLVFDINNVPDSNMVFETSNVIDYFDQMNSVFNSNLNKLLGELNAN